MPRRNKKGRFVKSRRRNTSRRSNPRRRNVRRRNVRRSNPTVTKAWSEVRKSLTSKTMVMKYAAGAAGAVVSAKGGVWLYGKLLPHLPATLAAPGWLNSALQAGLKVAVGAAISPVIPAGYKQAWLIGTGASALGQLVEPMLPASLSGLGFGGFLTTGQIRARGMNGMGGYLTTGQARRLGVAV